MSKNRTNQFLESMLCEWYGEKQGRAEMVKHVPGPVSLARAVEKVAGKIIPPWQLKLTELKDSWKEIVGPETARRCQASHLNEGVLYIEVFHPAYRIALETPGIKQDLLDRVRSVIGSDQCHEIKFIAGGRRPR